MRGAWTNEALSIAGGSGLLYALNAVYWVGFRMLPQTREVVTGYASDGSVVRSLRMVWWYSALQHVLPLLSIAAAVGMCHALDRRYRLTSGRRCAQCGYLLRGLSGNRCPECGAVFDPSRVEVSDANITTTP